MGLVRMGPPEELMLLLRRQCAVSTFVETGTFTGETAAWAAQHFERVITIENSKVYFGEAVRSHQHLRNIEFMYGDSRAVLAAVAATIHEPAIFWLDAHWCSMDSYGADDQCPVLEEIRIVHATGIKHHLFIDDARLFLSPPPLPNKPEQWPTIDQICSSFHAGDQGGSIVVFEDVIIGVPEGARPLVSAYCQAANTKAWREQGGQGASSGPDLIRQGLRLTARNAWLRLMQAVRR